MPCTSIGRVKVASRLWYNSSWYCCTSASVVPKRANASASCGCSLHLQARGECGTVSLASELSRGAVSDWEINKPWLLSTIPQLLRQFEHAIRVRHTMLRGRQKQTGVQDGEPMAGWASGIWSQALVHHRTSSIAWLSSEDRFAGPQCAVTAAARCVGTLANPLQSGGRCVAA